MTEKYDPNKGRGLEWEISYVGDSLFPVPQSSINSLPLQTGIYPNIRTDGSFGGTLPYAPFNDPPVKTPYKFNEDTIIQEAVKYIDSTYDGHYAEKDGIQALEFIMANSESFDFLKGNVLKYAARYGKKEGYNKKDIFKAIHYLILLYHFSQKDIK